MIDHHFYRAADTLRVLGAVPSDAGRFSAGHLAERFTATATHPGDAESLLAFLRQIDLLVT